MPYYISNNDETVRYQANGQRSTIVDKPAAYSSESDAASAISSLGLSNVKVIFAVSFAAAASTP